MSHVILNDLWSRKRRLAGMFTAVLVGVAFLAGTLVLGDSVRNSFGTLFTEANRDTDAVVRSTHRITAEGVTAQGSIPESLVGTVARVDGVTPEITHANRDAPHGGERYWSNDEPKVP